MAVLEPGGDGRRSEVVKSMDAVMLVLSWTLFVPPAHDVNVHTMPDMSTCLNRARVITEKIADLEEGGLEAKLVARCISVPTNLQS